MVAEIISRINFEHIRAAVGRDCRCRSDRSRDSRTDRFAQPPTHAQRTSTHSSRHNSNLKLLRSKIVLFPLIATRSVARYEPKTATLVSVRIALRPLTSILLIAIDLSEFQNFRICRVLAGGVCVVLKLSFLSVS